MQSVHSPSVNTNQLPQTNIAYAQSNLYETLKANHANSDIEQNIIEHIDSIRINVNMINENFNDIKSSLESSLVAIEPNAQLHQQTTLPAAVQNDQFNKELLRRVCFVGFVGFVPWIVGDFYFSKNHASCHVHPLSDYFTMTGILGLVFITLSIMIYGFGGFTRKSYEHTYSVGFFCYIINFVFGMFGIGLFLDNLKSFSTCGQFITRYFLARSIQNICYFFIFFTSFIEFK